MNNNRSNNAERIKYLIETRHTLTGEGRKKLAHVLKLYKEMQEPMWISEQTIDKATAPVIAKRFNTKSDFDSYIEQKRGIEITPKENQSIVNNKKTKPSEATQFKIKYEKSDSFNINQTIVIKKLVASKEDLHNSTNAPKYCWTAYAKYERPDDEEENAAPEDDSGGDGEDPTLKEAAPMNQQQPQQPVPPTQPQQPMAPTAQQTGQQPQQPQQETPEEEEPEDTIVDDDIEITKSVPFTDEEEGAKILSQFLTALQL